METQVEESSRSVREISVGELANKLERGVSPFLLDVREPFERAICHLGGLFIPAREVHHRLNDIPRDREVIVYSYDGIKSRDVVMYLQESYNFVNLVNLSGGIMAWSREIDSSITTY